MQLVGDQIRVVVVSFEKDGIMNVYEKAIRPKERFFERLVHHSEPGLMSCVLRDLFPGHSMKLADDLDPTNDRSLRKGQKWGLTNLGETFIGNAVIYGIEKSMPVSATVSVEDVRRAVQDAQ